MWEIECVIYMNISCSSWFFIGCWKCRPIFKLVKTGSFRFPWMLVNMQNRLLSPPFNQYFLNLILIYFFYFLSLITFVKLIHKKHSSVYLGYRHEAHTTFCRSRDFSQFTYQKVNCPIPPLFLDKVKNWSKN